MYWPIGTPKTYATSSSSGLEFSLVISEDGVTSPFDQPSTNELPSPFVSSTASFLENGTASTAHDQGTEPMTPITPATPATPAVQSIERGDPDHYEAATPAPTQPSTSVKLPLKDPILALRTSRSGLLFTVITATSMTVWQTKPTAILAVVVRSRSSLETYGENVDLLMRPDSAILVVHTTLGYLITYSLATDSEAHVYKPYFPSYANIQRRRQTHAGPGGSAPDQFLWGPGEGGGVRDVSVRFRMVIKVDAGIESALALDDELVVATQKPSAVQCIRWTPDTSGSQTRTEMVSRMGWLDKKVTITEMTHDRPMNLSTWITSDGKAHAVQRVQARQLASGETDPKKLFKGYCFHQPRGRSDCARREDSLLVYTYENLLYHFIFTPYAGSVRLVQLGQIAFHGIVRSPARVRGLSWILPESQLVDGDPSQDVAVASVLFLVDAKLVLLCPSVNSEGHLKYDMRVISQNVEFYASMRDQPAQDVLATSPHNNSTLTVDTSLRNALWVFDGTEFKVWPDLQDVMRAASGESSGDLPPTVSIPIDFYPLSTLQSKGILLGVEADLVQRRDLNFSLFRFTIRTHLFLPNILRFLLVDNRAADAVSLAQQFQHLEYFPHALEMLLHQVLDDEVDSAPAPEKAILPRVLSLLSCFKEYLDIVVQCTRKTEARQWRTLFAYLPPVQELFEESLLRGSLKTAGGYLIILHTLDEMGSAPEQTVRLLSRAMREQDWDLCKELARFLAAMDETGDTLRDAMEQVNVSIERVNDSPSPGGGLSLLSLPSRIRQGHPRSHFEGSIYLEYHIHATVNFAMEDFVSESDSDYTSYWRDWFISSRGNEYFCEIDEDYLTDRFNLTGLNTEVQYYQYALDLVTDVFDLDCDDDMRETIEKSARHLYGLVHARYIVTTRGLQKMLEKYKKSDFGKCPRVMCQSHPLLPMGLSDVPNLKPVKLYCTRCEDIYNPKSSRHAAIDGAYFGTSFHNVLFQVYPTLVPAKSIERYVPRVYGFKVHASAALIRWQNQKKDDMRRRLRKMDVEVGFRDDNPDDLEEESGDARVAVVQDATGQNAVV
ncbi:hypothetical protein ACHAQA_009167 [Verticillium albo-atrum]